MSRLWIGLAAVCGVFTGTAFTCQPGKTAEPPDIAVRPGHFPAEPASTQWQPRATAAHANGPQTWDVTKDFGFKISKGNPNGAWTYGMVDNSVFVPYTLRFDEAHRQRWHGNLGPDRTPSAGIGYAGAESTGSQPGQFDLHPGPGCQASVARWTAPADIAPRVRVQGRFLSGDTGIMEVGIFVNGTPQVTKPRWHATDSGEFDLILPVAAGDTIDFAVYGGYVNGTTPLEATITAVPEAQTVVLPAAGGKKSASTGSVRGTSSGGSSLSIKRDLARAYYRRGVSYQSKGDYDSAIADFTAAIQLGSDLVAADQPETRPTQPTAVRRSR